MASALGMIYRVTAIAATAVLLYWFADDAAAISGRQLWQTGEMTLIFDRRIQPLADEVNRYFPLVKQELEQTFGWALLIPPTIVLIADKNDFQRIAADPLFVAVAIPTRNTIVIDASRAQAETRSLRIILAHELAHLLLHQHIRSARLPRWLDEGVCQWFTGGVAEIMIDPHRPMLGKALRSGEFIELTQLTKGFPTDPRRLMLAYEQSRDMVTFIANRFGPEKIIGVLNRMREGDEIDISVYSQLGITLEELQKLWQKKRSGRVIWWARAASHLYPVLFFVAAVLTVAGFVMRRARRRREYENELDVDFDNFEV